MQQIGEHVDSSVLEKSPPSEFNGYQVNKYHYIYILFDKFVWHKIEILHMDAATDLRNKKVYHLFQPIGESAKSHQRFYYTSTCQPCNDGKISYMYRLIYGTNSITKIVQLVRLNYTGNCGHYILMKDNQYLSLPDNFYEIKKIPINEESKSIESVRKLSVSD